MRLDNQAEAVYQRLQPSTLFRASMRIAVISDVHDQVSNLRLVLKALAPLSPKTLLCCGDITRPKTLEVMLDFPGEVRFCLGNCDAPLSRELLALTRIHPLLIGFPRLGTLALESGASAAFIHSPAEAAVLADSGRYRAVFYGHTHQREAALQPLAEGA